MELNLDVSTLAQLVGAPMPEGLQPRVIKKIASLETAGPEDIAVVIDRGEASVFGAVSTEKIKQSGAGLILASTCVVPEKNFLVVNDVLAAFEKLVAAREQAFCDKHHYDARYPHAQVSTQAQVADDVSVAAGVYVGPYACVAQGAILGMHSVVDKGAVVGAGVCLYPGARILERCVVGDYSIIHANAVIGSDGFGYQVTKLGLRKIPQVGIVRIGKYVEIGAQCAIDRASFDETIIGDGVKLDNMVHVAHNVVIGASTAILAQTGIAGSVKIGVGCQIGGQVAIKDNLVIGNGVKIVSKSAVMENLADGAVVAGIPAVPFTQWKRMAVAFSKLPELAKMAHEFKAFTTAGTFKKHWWQRLFGGGK